MDSQGSLETDGTMPAGPDNPQDRGTAAVGQRASRQARVGILRNPNAPRVPPPHRPPLSGKWMRLRSSRRPLAGAEGAGPSDPQPTQGVATRTESADPFRQLRKSMIADLADETARIADESIRGPVAIDSIEPQTDPPTEPPTEPPTAPPGSGLQARLARLLGRG